MTIVDSHLHIWQLRRGDYNWLTSALGPIYRDFNLDDVAHELSTNPVEKVILVQAAATAAETDFMLAAAANDARVAGVVGWTDFVAEDAVLQVLRRAETPLIVGLRPMIGDIDDPTWVTQPHIGPVFQAMSETGLVFDGHARCDLIRPLTQIAQRHPQLAIVLNHGGKPDVARLLTKPDAFGRWRENITALAANENVSCKLSGLLTETGGEGADQDLSPFVATIIAVFGPARVMWGSDWPVVTLKGSYDGWFHQAQRLTAHLGSAERAAIFGGTAVQIYGLKDQN